MGLSGIAIAPMGVRSVLCRVSEWESAREMERKTMGTVGRICFLLFYFIYAKYFEKEHKNSKLNYT